MTVRHSAVPLLLCGPTAVGKSGVALELAARLNGEIISVDSMQVYRGMDIGTAKPTPAERQRIPHHLLDVADFSKWFDAAQFLELATVAVNEIQGRGRLPVFCGGTGLYFKAYLSGLSQAPPADPALRAELRNTPLQTLVAELERLDPETYNRIDRQNPRRVIRAVEVIRLTGKPFSVQRLEWRRGHDPQRGLLLGLNRSPADLRARIDERVEQMFRSGLVEETRRLAAEGLEQNPAALQALGYRQVIEHLEGKHTLQQTIQLVKTRTWQFAKRQLTFFRGQLEVQWIEVERDASASDISRRLMEQIRDPQ